MMKHIVPIAIALGVAAADLAAAQTTRLPPVSIEDTLAFRQIEQVQIKPDGAQVAFVTRKAILGTRKNEDTFMTVPADGGASRALLSGDEIQLTNWDKGGRLSCVLRKLDSSTQVVQVNIESGRTDVLWQTDLTVENAATAANGRFCLVAIRVPRERMSEQQAKDDGFVFEYGRDTFESLAQHYDVAWLDVFAVDAAKTARKVARLPYEGIQHPANNYVADLSIASDDRKAALTLIREGKPTQGGPSVNPDIAVLDLQSGVFEPVLPGSLHVEVAATWLSGSERLFFFSNGEGKIYDTKSKSIDALTWAKLKSPFGARFGNSHYESATDSVTYRQPAGGLGHVFFKDHTMQFDDDAPDGASYTRDGARYAFVSESSQQRPEVAVRDMKSGDSRRLTDLNAYLDQRALGKVEKWTFTNRYGAEATGYLMYPAFYEQGKRYPLLLASYGFRGKFPLIAEWHTSFPAQTLAGEGYAVLMLNLPSGVLTGQAVTGNPRQARENEGWQVLSTFETAIEDLVKRGIADPDRLGIYGWSHGGFVVEFLLAHSKLHFKAACLGEGGDYNPGEYWIWGNRTWPAILTNLYGGPLTTKTAAGYLEFAPSLNVNKVNTPLLMEFATIGKNYGAEFYIPMREMGVPAELVFYDREKHNFERPTVRFVSMNRKVDWFNFWMLGTEDPAPAKAEQYTRWKKMKADWKSGPGVAKNDADLLQQGAANFDGAAAVRRIAAR